MYSIFLKREKDLEEVTKDNKKEAGMLGSFRVFETIHDSQSSLNEVLQAYEKIDPLFACFSLENSGTPTSERNKDKPILSGSYKLEWCETSCTMPSEYEKCLNGRNKGILLSNPNDASFRDRKILIHVGNTAHDTLGCILLGTQHDDKMIYKSKEAIKRFFDFLSDKGVENFTLYIIDK
ncbi:DUF5675 family protein [Helicobacter cetorum]|uniref:DUF5675 domain-containing protein n=1 Tax=Helicobacter cetorum (strain ATCC BAA-540 / CCUG 52418 / MIT 99-5656) TaxID=1163745 RepID=I0EQK8_HELCM|nr:DUF5675 family protein [Helicobacter cetorum]AFI05227.1 hypothetical protein HCD_00975 [Helicobacter cetorum MIT 99-5656]